MRLIHVSDLHILRWPRRVGEWVGKRSVAGVELLLGRARRFSEPQLVEVVREIQECSPDHVLVTGDLTTLALPSEFAAARRVLAPLLEESGRVSILPGNHDRYTRISVRRRLFEGEFGSFAPAPAAPWLRLIDRRTAILALDASRAHFSASGAFSRDHLERAGEVLSAARPTFDRLIVACHYPVAVPPEHTRSMRTKPLHGAGRLIEFLGGLSMPYLYCCGQVHASWVFEPPSCPGQLSLNPGAAADTHWSDDRPSGFYIIDISDEGGVRVCRRGYTGTRWRSDVVYDCSSFYA